jgi:hypothetical protein
MKKYGGACKNAFTCNALKQQAKLSGNEQNKAAYRDQCQSCKVGGRRTRRRRHTRRRHTSRRHVSRR